VEQHRRLEALRDSLGAADTTDPQIRLAFQLGKRHILQAVQQYGSLPYVGQRIRLSLDGLSRLNVHEEIASLAGSGEPGLTYAKSP
jgi:hypothetical protein